ncbi:MULTISPECIES: hypothetical protein [Clostridium]|uniref:hypothetical protein n=1 Tax=Clostridium TaxID=1485 RepID=UPI00069FC75A|nr:MULTISPECIES: hypothetical protein [Clostridium]KOF57182.1 hypothetical protein AGR56_11925 [Clostridium sp. DMHC 10]MCD2348089.1 hypothetical protein [Clostridium guangxiense]
MSFSNKTVLGTIGGLIIAFLAITLFIKILPVILVVGLTIWGVFKITKWFESKSNKKMEFSKKDEVTSEFSSEDKGFGYDKDNVVDVDYTEVKK